LEGGLSTYGYVGSSPLIGIDPLGLLWEPRPETMYELGRTHGAAANRAYNKFRDRRRWGHERFPGEVNSFMRHCTVTCMLSKEFGSWPARLAGIGNEYQ